MPEIDEQFSDIAENYSLAVLGMTDNGWGWYQVDPGTKDMIAGYLYNDLVKGEEKKNEIIDKWLWIKVHETEGDNEREE